MRVPFLDLAAINGRIRDEIDAAVAGVFDSGWFVRGPAVSAFETDWAGYVGAAGCAGVGTGLDALRLALTALGIGPGDDVLVPSHTFIATWLAVSSVGAGIVPVEPDPATMLVDADRLLAAATPETAAVVPVDLYGMSCDTGAIMSLAGEQGWVVVEDAAQAHGAELGGRRVGAGAHAVAWSFYPAKNLGAVGDGGAVTSDDRDLLERIRVLGNYGSRSKYVHDVAGINSRLDDIQAAVLRVRLAHLEADNARRGEIAQAYLSGLATVEAVTLPPVIAGRRSAWHLFVIRHPRRDALAAGLRAVGVETLIHYPEPPHRSGAFRAGGWRAAELPVAEELASTVLSLPIGPHLSDEQVSYVVDRVTELA